MISKSLTYIPSNVTKFSRIRGSSFDGESLRHKTYCYLYSCLLDCEFYYPNFRHWYFEKVKAGLENGTRELLIVTHQDSLAGIAIIKNNIYQSEKKICTLKVMPQYLKQGIGSQLFYVSMNILDTDKPLITVPSFKLPEFQNIFSRLGYTTSYTYPDLYFKDKVEYSFNCSLK